MKSRVAFLSVADREFADAVQWYEDQEARLGRRLFAAVKRSISRIVEHPARFPIISGEIRRAQATPFPYGIFYIVDDDRIVVVGVIHLRRDPTDIRQLLDDRA